MIGLPLYGGVEGYITDGIKGGEWNTSLNFFIGMGASFFSITSISVIASLFIKNEAVAEMSSSAATEWMKNTVKNSITGGEGNGDKGGPSTSTKESQTNSSSQNGNKNNSGTERQSSNETESGTEKTMETTENHPEKETNKTTQEVEKPVHNLNTNSTPSIN